jgi:hypothetical protein
VGGELRFGYDGYLSVKDTLGRELWKKKIISDQEIGPWMKANSHSVQGWGILKSTFVPVRVDNVADFGRDLFLPTFVNHVLKIKNVFLKVLAAIIAIPWDLLTLPVRCLTSPLRWAYFLSASKNKPVPVVDLIQTSPHFKKAMKEGFVHLEAHTSDMKVTQTWGERFSQNKIPGMKDWPTMAAGTVHKETRLVNLKALPWHQENSTREDWTVEYTRDPIHGWRGGMKTGSAGESSSLAG